MSGASPSGLTSQVRGWVLAKAALQAGVGLSAVFQAAEGRFPRGRKGCTAPSPPPRERYRTLREIFREVGVKHIPEAYLHASVSQRRALLAWICWTRTAIATRVERLSSRSLIVISAYGVLELTLGLGNKATLRTRSCKGRRMDTSTVYVVAFHSGRGGVPAKP